MKLSVNDYKFIEKILELPANKVSPSDFAELKPSQFKYKIQKINYILKVLGKDFFYKRNNNYFIKSKDSLKFLISNFEFSHLNKIQRKNIILTKLLTEQYININALTEEFSQSRTSVKKDLEELQENLREFSLKLEYKHSRGTFICGAEKKIRLFFINFWLSYFEGFTLLEEKENEEKEKIEKIVFEVLKGRNSSFETAKILTIILYVQSYRIGNLNLITEQDVVKDIKIEENVSTLLDEFFIDSQEKDYFYSYLVGLRYSDAEFFFEHFYPELDEKITTFFIGMSNSLKVDLLEDEIFKKNLKAHLQVAIFKLINKIPILNPSVSNELKEFEQLSKKVKSNIKDIEKHFKIKFNIDEILFIAFHIKASLIRLENNKSKEKNILLVCNLGSGAEKILINELTKNFILNIVDSISYFQFKVYDLKGVDLIIHTLPNFTSEIPNCRVNTILTQKDIYNLQKLGLFLK